MSIASGVAQKVLSPVTDDKAFHFYYEVDKPTGISASSLNEFAAKLRSIDSNSVVFHSKRGDFENWVYMLGDPQLAKELIRVRDSNLEGDKLRSELVRVVQARLRKLQGNSAKKK